MQTYIRLKIFITIISISLLLILCRYFCLLWRYKLPVSITDESFLYVSTHNSWLQEKFKEIGWNIWIMTGDKNQCLTTTGYCTQPSGSPDKTEIVFTSYEDLKQDKKPYYYHFFIWKMNLGSKRLERISPNWLSCQSPDWSPDGRKIIFSANGYHEKLHLLANPQFFDSTCGCWKNKTVKQISADQEEMTEITRTLPDTFFRRSLYTMKPGGENLKRLDFLDDCINFAQFPSWSYDNRRVVFLGGGCEGINLYIADIVVESVMPVLEQGKWQNLSSPNWSPIDDKIVFISDRNIYIIDLSTNQIKQVTFDFVNKDPCWTHNGKCILFSRSHAHEDQIWQIDIETGIHKQLTLFTGDNVFPVAY